MLEWVLVGGLPRHAAEFANVPPRRRPATRCPVCDRRVILKLGTRRRYHVAHAPDAVCAATRPETGLHINCKMAIASALRGALQLSIRRQCAECDSTSVDQWIDRWDDVLVESRVENSRRPDVMLHRNTKPLAAIEVVVSHAMDAEKARVLAELGVPWIEVAADEPLAHGEWQPHEPLDVLRSSDAPEWLCDVHRAARAEARDAAIEAARHTSRLVAARVVDVYHADGRRERVIYRASERLTDGKAHHVQLNRGGLELMQAPAGDAAWPAVRDAFAADVRQLARHDGSFADSPMQWARGDAAENIVDEALTDMVGRDPTPLATRFPRRWYFAREQGRWFLPDDACDVRWDRAPHDAFAAHPAWKRSQTAVRERAVPPASWQTPFLAARPIGAMFRQSLVNIAAPIEGEPISLVEVRNAESGERATIAVIERATTAGSIREVLRRLDGEGIEAVWLSHPLEWTPALAGVAWCPAGRDARGRGGVMVDDIGVYTADQFVRALLYDGRRLTLAEIRRRMAARVERLGQDRR